MKRIVIKMRSMKKMVGDDLLKLALMLSLLKVSDIPSLTVTHRNFILTYGWVGGGVGQYAPPPTPPHSHMSS